MHSSLDVGNVNAKSENASRWLPTAATLTIIDPNQLKPLMKLPIAKRQELSQYHTGVLINSATALNFV